MLKLILLRHALTHANKEARYLGFSESEINQQGKRQIQTLTKKLKTMPIDAIYTSPSKRTIDTILPFAQITNIPIQTVDALREIHFGEFEGLTFKLIKENYPNELERMIALENEYIYPAGESLMMCYDRVSTVIDAIKKKHQDQTVLICTHAGPIRHILSHLISKSPKLHWHFKIDNASITCVHIEDEFAVIQYLNDTFSI